MNYSRKMSKVLLEDIEKDIERFEFLVTFANDCREIEKLENDLLVYRAELENWKLGTLSGVKIVQDSRCVNLEGIIKGYEKQVGILYKRDNEILNILEGKKDDLEFQIVYEYLIENDEYAVSLDITPIALKFGVSNSYVRRVLAAVNSFLEKRSPSIFACESYFDSETYPALYVMNITLSI